MPSIGFQIACFLQIVVFFQSPQFGTRKLTSELYIHIFAKHRHFKLWKLNKKSLNSWVPQIGIVLFGENIRWYWSKQWFPNNSFGRILHFQIVMCDLQKHYKGHVFGEFFLVLSPNNNIISKCGDCKNIATIWNRACFLKLHNWYSTETFKCKLWTGSLTK